MILGLKHNSLAGGHFDLPPCTESDPYTPCNKGLRDLKYHSLTSENPPHQVFSFKYIYFKFT